MKPARCGQPCLRETPGAQAHRLKSQTHLAAHPCPNRVSKQDQLRLPLPQSNIMLLCQLIHEGHLVLDLLLQPRRRVPSLPSSMSRRMTEVAERVDLGAGGERRRQGELEGGEEGGIVVR